VNRAHGEHATTYIYATWQSFGGEKEVEVKLVSTRLQPAVGAKNLLVLKQRRMAMIEFLAGSAARHRRYFGGIDGGFGAGGSFVDAHVPVKRDRQVCDANRLHGSQDHGTLHMVAGIVFAVWIGRADVEVSDVSVARTKRWQAEARKEGASRGSLLNRGGSRGGGSAFIGGGRIGAHLCFAAKICHFLGMGSRVASCQLGASVLICSRMSWRLRGAPGTARRAGDG